MKTEGDWTRSLEDSNEEMMGCVAFLEDARSRNVRRRGEGEGTERDGYEGGKTTTLVDSRGAGIGTTDIQHVP